MNLIGLDISKVSTGMVIEVNDEEFFFSYNTEKITQKWNKELDKNPNIKIRTYQYDNTIEVYTDSENNKLTQFIKISNDIITDIKSVINEKDNTIVYLEGYSYGKSVGPIIDLVGIASIIRGKLVEEITNLIELKIIAPKSLKLLTCELVYGAEIVDIGKRKPKIVKVINKNNLGIKGGDFSKHDMYQAIMDRNKNHLLSELYKEKYDDIMKVKKYPKPMEDINDAYLLKELISFTPLENN